MNGIQTHGSDDGHDPSDQGEDLGDDCDPENNSDVESSRHRAKSRRLDREAASDVEGEEYEETDDGSVSPVRRVLTSLGGSVF